MIYAYCRISTKKQNIERQIRNILQTYPDAQIFQEAFTGTHITGRKEFNKLLQKVKAGDTIVFDSVSRMSRNAEEGIDLYFHLYNKGIELVFLKESYINTSVYRSAASQSVGCTGNEIADIYIEATNKVIQLLAQEQIKKAFEQAQKEVDDMRQRTKEGLQTARDNGKVIGRHIGSKTIHNKKYDLMAGKIIKMAADFSGNMSDSEVIETLGIARNTYYKYKKMIRAELTAANQVKLDA